VRLDPRFRAALYAAFAVLTLTGAAWLIADWGKSAGPDWWQDVAADLLMLHGGAAMVTLLFLGALVPLHVQRAWRSRRNRVTGPAMVGLNALLITTAFGLYYAGWETLRPWISDLHIVVGLLLPTLLAVHVWLGRRSRAAAVISSADRGSRSGAALPSTVRPARPARADTSD
jgi:hypothetical protein